MITLEHSMEHLNVAFVHAIAAKARLKHQIDAKQADGPDYGVDGFFRLMTTRNGKPQPTGAQLDFQLKSSRRWKQDKEYIKYPIKKIAYNKMAHQNSQNMVQIILILYCLPKDPEEWIEFNDQETILRRCCYYFNIGCELLKSEKGEKTIKIPKTNLLTPDSLSILITEIQPRRGAA